MYVKTVIIKNETGLHARPAAEFVACAKKFQSQILIRKAGSEEAVNAKSIMKVLSQCLSQGTEIEVIAQGEDEVRAAQELAFLVEGRFGESE